MGAVMKCEKLRQELMEALLSGPQAVSPELRQHLESCEACAGELASLQQTMTLLDDWQTPEPSPYFNTRLRARMREEAAAPAQNWLAWLRRPVVAVAAAVLIALGAGLLEIGHLTGDHNTLANNESTIRTGAPSSAVGDLQYLDKNADLFSDFDALDGQSATE
jgi:anti-sigma factor RsiW